MNPDLQTREFDVRGAELFRIFVYSHQKETANDPVQRAARIHLRLGERINFLDELSRAPLQQVVRRRVRCQERPGHSLVANRHLHSNNGYYSDRCHVS